MLPLYPGLKIKIERLLLDIAQQAAQSRLGPFTDTPRVKQHEGDRLEYTTIDGDKKATGYQRMGVGIEISPADVPTMTFDQVVELMTSKGIEIGTQQVEFYFKVLNESIEEVGNAINVGGKPFTVDLFMQMLERVQIPFDDHGDAYLPALHSGPDLEESIKHVLEEVYSSADAQARLKEIVDRKRNEWDEQQDSRKLVD